MEGTRTRLSELIIFVLSPSATWFGPPNRHCKKIMCLLLKQQQGKVSILFSKEVAETLLALANPS